MARATIGVVAAGIATLAAGCASAGAGAKSTAGAACGLADRDSVFARGGPVYRECGVDRVARRLAPNVHPDFRPAEMRSACYSVDLEFVVDSTGAPDARTARIARTNDQAFAQAVLETLPLWKYDPAVREQRHVRQIVVAHEMASTSNVLVPVGSPMPTGPPRDRPITC